MNLGNFYGSDWFGQRGRWIDWPRLVVHQAGQKECGRRNAVGRIDATAPARQQDERARKSTKYDFPV